jgi:hypothetical protein
VPGDATVAGVALRNDDTNSSDYGGELSDVVFYPRWYGFGESAVVEALVCGAKAAGLHATGIEVTEWRGDRHPC